MAKHILNDVTLRNAKPGAKDKRLNDGGGLYLCNKCQAMAVVIGMIGGSHEQ